MSGMAAPACGPAAMPGRCAVSPTASWDGGVTSPRSLHGRAFHEILGSRIRFGRAVRAPAREGWHGVCKDGFPRVLNFGTRVAI